MSDRMLTPEDVAKRLAVTPNTVRGWLRVGTLKGVKVGRRVWRVEENSLKGLISREGQVDYCQEATEVNSVNIGRRLALADALKKESLLIKDDSMFVLREFEALEDED